MRWIYSRFTNRNANVWAFTIFHVKSCIVVNWTVNDHFYCYCTLIPINNPDFRIITIRSSYSVTVNVHYPFPKSHQQWIIYQCTSYYFAPISRVEWNMSNTHPLYINDTIKWDNKSIKSAIIGEGVELCEISNATVLIVVFKVAVIRNFYQKN